MEHNVQLTDDLVEKLTPEKGAVDEQQRIAILEKLGESLMTQGNYHLATKKFTQAGDKVCFGFGEPIRKKKEWNIYCFQIKGMKSLLKSGDTEKIIFFANVSRQKEIYVMAANYLQSLDWQNKPDILRNIIAFYSKGKSLDLLANFYVACAQVEIDEFQNYEKAYGAMMEASRCLTKVANPRDALQHRKATEIVQQRLGDIKKFIDVRRLFERGDVQSGSTCFFIALGYDCFILFCFCRFNAKSSTFNLRRRCIGGFRAQRRHLRFDDTKLREIGQFYGSEKIVWGIAAFFEYVQHANYVLRE